MLREQARVDRASAAKAAASSDKQPMPLFAPPVKGREQTSDSTKVRRVLGRFDDMKSIVLDNQHDFIGVQQQPETPTVLFGKKLSFPSLSSDGTPAVTSSASSKSSSSSSSKPVDGVRASNSSGHSRQHERSNDARTDVHVHGPPPAKSSAEQKQRSALPQSSQLATKAGEGGARERLPAMAGGRDKGQQQQQLPSKSHNGVSSDDRMTSSSSVSKPTPHLKMPLQPAPGRPSLAASSEQVHAMKAFNSRMSTDSIEDVFKEMDLPISSPITALPSHSPHKDQRFFPPLSQKSNVASEKSKTPVTVTKPVSSILDDLDISSDSDDDSDLASPTEGHKLPVTNSQPSGSLAPPPRLASLMSSATSTSRSASPALGAVPPARVVVPPSSTSSPVKPGGGKDNRVSLPVKEALEAPSVTNKPPSKTPAIKTSSSTSRMPMPQMPNKASVESTASKSKSASDASAAVPASVAPAGLLKSQPSVTFKTAAITSPSAPVPTAAALTATSVICTTATSPSTKSVTDSKSATKSTLIASKPTTVSKVPRRLSESSDESSSNESEAENDKDSIATEAGEADQEMLEAAAIAVPVQTDDATKATLTDSLDTGKQESADDNSDSMKQARNWSLGTWLQPATANQKVESVPESSKPKTKAEAKKAAKEEKAANRAKQKAAALDALVAEKEKTKKGSQEAKNNDKFAAKNVKLEIADNNSSKKKKDTAVPASDSGNSPVDNDSKRVLVGESRKGNSSAKTTDKMPSKSAKDFPESNNDVKKGSSQEEKLEAMRTMLREDAATSLGSRKRTTSNLSSASWKSSDDEHQHHHNNGVTESKRLRLSDASTTIRPADLSPVVRDSGGPTAAFLDSEALALMSNIYMRNRSVSSDSNGQRDDRENEPAIKPVYHPKFGITYYNGHAEVLVRIDVTRLHDLVHLNYDGSLGMDDAGPPTKRAMHDSRVAVVGPYKHSTAHALSASEDGGHLSREASRFAEVSARLLSGSNGSSASPAAVRQGVDVAAMPPPGAAGGANGGGSAAAADVVRFKMAAAEDVRTQLFPDMDRGLAGTRIPRRKADAAAAFDPSNVSDARASSSHPMRPNTLAYNRLEDGSDAVERHRGGRFAGDVTSPPYTNIDWEQHDGHRWQIAGGAENDKASHFRSSQPSAVRDWDAPDSRTADDGAGPSHHLHQSQRQPGAHAGVQWAALLAGNTSAGGSGSQRQAASSADHRADHSSGTEALLQLIAQNRPDAADKCLQEAKRLKHEADNTSDRLVKQLKYMEAVVCFVLCGCAMENDSLSLAEPNKIFKMYDDTLRLLRNMVGYRVGSDANADRSHDKEVKLVTLSYRLQALLFLRLYKIRKPETLKLKKIIDDYNKQQSKAASNSSSNGRPSNLPSPSSPQPSPAGSIGSVGSTGSAGEMQQRGGGAGTGGGAGVPVPQRIHSVTQQYVSHVGHLQLAHELWEQADSLATSAPHAAFFKEVDRACGSLTIHSGMTDLVRYVHAGLRRLKDTVS